jgi:hypothetical protein
MGNLASVCATACAQEPCDPITQIALRVEELTRNATGSAYTIDSKLFKPRGCDAAKQQDPQCLEDVLRKTEYELNELNGLLASIADRL